jgi:tripartite-type tricarboxylate transporter receptor subunit TctC
MNWSIRTPIRTHRWRRMALAACLAVALPCVLASQGRADEVEDFYKGQSVKVVIGHSAGGGYDLYARLLSKHLRKHIPGQPTIVPQNMTGAGGLRVTNYLYSAAPKDGTVIGTFSRSIPTMPLLTPPGTFDARRFSWLGSMSGDTSLCLSGGKSAVKSWKDMLSKPLIMGGQAVGTDSDIYARLYKNVLGAQIKIVSGYPGTTEITLAMERGEVDGICGLSWGTIKVSHPQWRQNKSVNFLLQAGLKTNPELSDVPFAMDLVDDAAKKQILYLHFAPQAMGRPFAAPPDIPPARKAALIRAFDATMKDPELLADAAKAGMDIDPMPGSEIDALLTQIYATPSDVVAKAARAVAD